MKVFTIVIAIRNVAEELSATLDSLDSQSFRDFEVIIADCNSTDNPGQYVQNRSYPIQHIVQNDTGIYDAWNKVLPLAQGEWVSFMGAGDYFVSDQTLSQAAEILNALPDDTLIAYGQIDALGENGRVLHSTGAPWPQQLREIAAFYPYAHQATFQRRRSFLDYGYFDSSLLIAGDTDMILRLSKVSTPVFFDLKVAHFQFGGVSNRLQNRQSVIDEHFAVLRRHAIRAKNHGVAIWKARVVRVLIRFLPRPVLHAIIDTYRKFMGRKPRFR